MKAIVYESNAGHTKEYARMLSEKLNIPYFTRKEATKQLKKSSEIIYLGWVCATKVQGFKKVISKYQVKCIIAVGIYPNSNEYIESLKNSNNIEGHFFYLQGGLDCKKLKGMKKKIIQMIGNVMEKENKEENQEMIKIFKNGANFVSEKNLDQVLEFLSKM